MRQKSLLLNLAKREIARLSALDEGEANAPINFLICFVQDVLNTDRTIFQVVTYRIIGMRVGVKYCEHYGFFGRTSLKNNSSDHMLPVSRNEKKSYIMGPHFVEA